MLRYAITSHYNISPDVPQGEVHFSVYSKMSRRARRVLPFLATPRDPKIEISKPRAKKRRQIKSAADSSGVCAATAFAFLDGTHNPNTKCTQHNAGVHFSSQQTEIMISTSAHAAAARCVFLPAASPAAPPRNSHALNNHLRRRHVDFNPSALCTSPIV